MNELDIVSAKAELRSRMLQRRAAISRAQRIIAARQLVSYSMDLIRFIGSPGQMVAGYWPIASELNILPLLYKLQQAGMYLCLPCLEGKSMLFRSFDFSQMGCLVRMAFGTIGPGVEARMVYPDVILLPLLACDNKGRRLGYGGGFYDKYIAAVQNKPALIGVGFASQMVDMVEVESHDKILDAVLTPNFFGVFAGGGDS